MTIRTHARTLVLALALAATAGSAHAKNPMVGGAPMYASKSIVENAVNSRTTPPSSPP